MIVTPDVDKSTPTIEVFGLSNSHGMTMKVTNFGGRIVSLAVPDKNGKFADVVLGYDNLRQYLNGNPYFGAVIGRVANRIARGKFILKGKEYSIPINNGNNTLHSGPSGFHNVFWKEISGSTQNTLQLEYLSKDGEEGYPGNVTVVVTYTLTEDNSLILDYSATTDKTTLINLTNHSYFNLAGEGNGDILNHLLTINAHSFMPVDQGLIPTGEIRKVERTPFDFSKARKIGEQISGGDEQLKLCEGYDHNWVLNKEDHEVSLAAKVVEPNSGRVMEVLTSEPGLQFYAGNFLDGNDVGKNGNRYLFRSAFCLETQHFPDSPNHPDFPSIVLEPGEVYRQKTIYKFSALK